MPMDVEIELRIPTLTVKIDEDKTQRIDNSLVRFRKVIQVPAFPRPGSQIAISISPGAPQGSSVFNSHCERLLKYDISKPSSLTYPFQHKISHPRTL